MAGMRRICVSSMATKSRNSAISLAIRKLSARSFGHVQYIKFRFLCPRFAFYHLLCYFWVVSRLSFLVSHISYHVLSHAHLSGQCCYKSNCLLINNQITVDQLDPEARRLPGPTHGWLLTQSNANDQPIGFPGFGRRVFNKSASKPKIFLETGKWLKRIYSYAILLVVRTSSPYTEENSVLHRPT